jgi:peptide deformylase
MDSSLFSKIKQLVEEKTKDKKELIEFLHNKTGIAIEENQIDIKGKKVILYLNSNQKLLFKQRNGNSFIIEKGFTTE